MDSQLIEDSVRYSNNFTPANNIMVKKMVTQTVQVLHNPSTTYAQISAAINTKIGPNAQINLDDDTGALTITINEYLVNKTMADPNTGVWKSSYQIKGLTDDSYEALKLQYS